MCQQQQGGMFAAFRKVINVIPHPITAGSWRRCPELVTGDLLPPQKSHHHFQSFAGSGDRAASNTIALFWRESLHEPPDVALGNRKLH